MIFESYSKFPPFSSLSCFPQYTCACVIEFMNPNIHRSDHVITSMHQLQMGINFTYETTSNLVIWKSGMQQEKINKYCYKFLYCKQTKCY